MGEDEPFDLFWTSAGSFQIVQNDLLRASYPAVDKANFFPVNKKGINESGNFLAGRIGYLKGDFQDVNMIGNLHYLISPTNSPSQI